MSRALLVVCVILSCPQLSQAQRWYAPPRGNRVGALNSAYAGGYVPRFGFGVGNVDFASTAAEGRMRGYADIVRSQGAYNLATSEAMKNYQDARSKYIDNQMKWTKTYWERKRIGEEQIQAERDKKREARDRYLAAKHDVRSSSEPTGLSPTQLDPNNGKLYWPTPLTAPEFAEPRKRLEELFVLNAHTQTTPTINEEVKEASGEMMDLVRDNIKKMTANDYVSSRKFIEALPYSL